MVSGWLKSRPDVIERNISEFRCSEALLEHLRRFALDIVFLDYKMDSMDGIETAKAIRRRDNEKKPYAAWLRIAEHPKSRHGKRREFGYPV